jgi:hypothetical protein
LVWLCPNDSDSDNLHFMVYIDTGAGDSLVANSSLDTSGFKYWNGSDYDTFPGNGVDTNVYNETVTYKLQFSLTEDTYTWTVIAYDGTLYSDTPNKWTFKVGGRTWTDGTITSGSTPIRKIHMDELREETNYYRNCRGLTDFSFTDPTITAGVTLIRKTHIDEIRQAIEEAANAAGEDTPVWTDSSLTAGQSPIRKVHFDEMRQSFNDY